MIYIYILKIKISIIYFNECTILYFTFKNNKNICDVYSRNCNIFYTY